MKQVLTMNYEIIIGYLKKSPLFSGLDTDAINHIVDSGHMCEFKRGECVRGEESISDEIGIILSGRVRVTRGKAVISSLGEGGLFGAAAVFDNAPTAITAQSKTEIFMIPCSVIRELVKSDGEFALQFIACLSGKISFLTGRIEALSGSTATGKLESYLLSSENGYTDCSNMTLLAKKLDMGRASLYRALKELEEKEIISREGDKIYLKER